MVSSPPRTAPPRAQRPGAAPRRPISARQRAVYRRRRIVAAVLAVVLLVLLILGVRAVLQALTGGGDQAAADSVATTDQAVRLELPTGDAAITLAPADVNDSNRIDPEPGEAVWYTGHDRVRPGELGTAVIVGHAEHDGSPDAFADLGSLSEGERVTITFADGVTLELDVVSTKVLSEEELQESALVWDDQLQTHRTVLVTSDTVEHDGQEGHVLVVSELG